MRQASPKRISHSQQGAKAMQFEYDPALNEWLTVIKLAVIEGVPEVIRATPASDRPHALLLLYQDSSSESFDLTHLLVGSSIVNRCRVAYADHSSFVDCVWRPQQTLDDHVRAMPFGGHELNEALQSAYELMLAANKSDLPLPDEGGLFLPVRQTLYQAARELNERNWSAAANVDPDFVVVALDFIGCWTSDDLRGCLSETKRQRLIDRGLL
jgi:hypothetical protein